MMQVSKQALARRFIENGFFIELDTVYMRVSATAFTDARRHASTEDV